MMYLSEQPSGIIDCFMKNCAIHSHITIIDMYIKTFHIIF